jgi:hypothetical protein
VAVLEVTRLGSPAANHRLIDTRPLRVSLRLCLATFSIFDGLKLGQWTFDVERASSISPPCRVAYG